MRITTPLALLLLLSLPVIFYLGWPRRGIRQRREWSTLVLRLVIASCLIFSLAGLAFTLTAHNLAVVFLVDVSDSMPNQAVVYALGYIRQALQAMGPDDQAAVIVFAAEALVERSMSSGKDLPDFTSKPVTSQTDLAEAMRLALALYPPGAVRRMVIFSDGVDTARLAVGRGGSLSDAARLASASGVQILVVPFAVATGSEVMLTALDAPGSLRQGEKFNLDVSLHSTRATRASIQVFSGDQLVYEGNYDLLAGDQSFTLPLVAGEPGFVRYKVLVATPDDHYYQNNELGAYTQVQGPPKILMIVPPEGESLGYQGETRPDESTALVNALRSAGYSVDVLPPSGLPSDLVTLTEYDSLVMVDVPAPDLSQRQMQAVQSYVRDLGGGLVMVGGPTSYGVGGYFRTPLEETLPVEMQIKDEQRRPSLAIVLIIDHSGSMSETSGGPMKLELAKQAAIWSVELLSPMDRVGVVAFDESASWVVQLTDLSEPDEVVRAIGSIRSGGGTDIYAGLQAMAGVLPGDPAKVKHAILLTDGGADPTGIPELVKSLYEQYGITLSTVGVGQDAAPYLEQLAEIGGGRYYFTADPSTIPNIFTEETILATRAYIIEETFFPEISGISPILVGITETPPLYGYVGTSAKNAAQTILVSDKGDPVLAAWQYGLGRVVAFTSDASGRWAKDWVQWQGFATFWAQALSYTFSERQPASLQVSVDQHGELANLVVDAFRPETGEYINQYLFQASLVAPDRQAISIPLNQVAPGKYEASFTPTQPGVYLIHVNGESSSQSGSSGAKVTTTTGWVMSYSPEYRYLETDAGKLSSFVAELGGKIASDNPDQIFVSDRTAPPVSRPIWPWLILLAAILLPFDIGVRRLVISWEDMRSWWMKIRLRVISIAHRRAMLPVRPRSIDVLIQLKERLRPTGDGTRQILISTPGVDQPVEKKPVVIDTGEEHGVSQPESAILDHTVEDKNKTVLSTTSALLASKRKRSSKE